MTKRQINFVFSLLIALVSQGADTITTIIGLEMGAVEKNPAMAWVITEHGYGWFVVAKLTAVIYFTALSFWSKTFAIACSIPFFYYAWGNYQIIQGF
jgi:hypothetical protein